MIPTINQNQKNLPSLLKEKKQWVLWKLEEKKIIRKPKFPIRSTAMGQKVTILVLGQATMKLAKF